MQQTESQVLAPQVQRPRCASLTVKGRPCKARPQTEWTPFCQNHAPRGPVEFVGGGPLDGLYFHRRYFYIEHAEVIVVARAEDDRVVVHEPCGERWVDVHPRDIIGVYRYGFRGLLPEWRWEVAPIQTKGKQECW